MDHLKRVQKNQRWDVRKEIARTAGVSVGNVSKVKEILLKAAPEIVQALKNGEIRIHRASGWCRLPLAQQRRALEQYQSQKGVKHTIRRLINRHQRKNSPITVDSSDLILLVRGLESGTLDAINIRVVNTPGRAIFVTEELARSLGGQKGLQLPCSTNSR